MTESDDDSEEYVHQSQVKTALRFLEWSHGDSLRRPWSDEAHAYYQAITIIESALDEELRPPDEIPRLHHDQEMVEKSRQAREEGYASATLLHERYGEKESRTQGTVAKLWAWIQSKMAFHNQ